MIMCYYSIGATVTAAPAVVTVTSALMGTILAVTLVL